MQPITTLPLALLSVVTGTIVLATVVQLLPEGVARKLTNERGPFEILSAASYGIAFAIAALQLLRQRSHPRFAALVLLLWTLLRELDFQKRFTYRSIESLGYYTRPYAAWSEKLLVLLILAPFVVAGCYLLRLLLRRVRPALERGEKWVAYVIVAIALGIISLVLEKLLHWGKAEEVCETGLALVVLMLTWELRLPPAVTRARVTL